MLNSKAQIALLLAASVLISGFLILVPVVTDYGASSQALGIIVLVFAAVLVAVLVSMVVLGKRQTGWGSARVGLKTGMVLQGAFFLPLAASSLVLSREFHHQRYLVYSAIFIAFFALSVVGALFVKPKLKPGSPFLSTQHTPSH